jgi:hypothetical protein
MDNQLAWSLIITISTLVVLAPIYFAGKIRRDAGGDAVA